MCVCVLCSSEFGKNRNYITFHVCVSLKGFGGMILRTGFGLFVSLEFISACMLFISVLIKEMLHWLLPFWKCVAERTEKEFIKNDITNVIISVTCADSP